MAKSNNDYPPKGTVFDLEQAIKMHIEGQRTWIHPKNSSVFNAHKELHIKTIEKSPRDSIPLLKLIGAKKAEKDRATDILDTQKLICELDALEWMLAIVRRHEDGKSLDCLAY